MKRARVVLCCVLAGITITAPRLPAQGLHPPGTAAPSSPAATRSREVEVAQRLLKRLNLLDEPATGVPSERTRTALRDFATSRRLPATDEVTPPLLRALRTAAWQQGGWAGKQVKGQEDVLDPAGIKEAQQLLEKLGYVPGPVDGGFGPQTLVAVESFQTDLDIGVDGLVTRTTLMNLQCAAQLKSSDAAGTVRVLNYSDYIDPAVVRAFQERTKIRVVYDTYGSREELEARLRRGQPAWDVVVPSGEDLERYIKDELIQPLDKSKLKNIGNLDPEIVAYSDTWDRGNRYAVAYLWGTIGIAWNRALVEQVAPGGKMDTVAALFDPDRAKALAKCGLRVIDSATDVFPSAMLASGQNAVAHDPGAIAKGEAALLAVKAWVRPVSSQVYIDQIASGKICAALMYSGDAVQARSMAKAGVVIDYRVPTEGGLLWIDHLAIPTKAPHLDAAYAFIDHLLDPKVIAAVSNEVGYANGNAKAGPFMKPEILHDPGIFPGADALKRLAVSPPLAAEGKAAMGAAWARFSAN